MESLAEQLRNIPLDKVKVTEVCQRAEISKGTFYLHYQDIYQLADAFIDARVEAVFNELGGAIPSLSDVSEFVRTFVSVFRSSEQEEFLRIADGNRMAPVFMDRILKRFADQVSERYPEPETIQLRLAITYAISGSIGAMRSNPDVSEETLVVFLTELMTKTMKRME